MKVVKLNSVQNSGAINWCYDSKNLIDNSSYLLWALRPKDNVRLTWLEHIIWDINLYVKLITRKSLNRLSYKLIFEWTDNSNHQFLRKTIDENIWFHWRTILCFPKGIFENENELFLETFKLNNVSNLISGPRTLEHN